MTNEDSNKLRFTRFVCLVYITIYVSELQLFGTIRILLYFLNNIFLTEQFCYMLLVLKLSTPTSSFLCRVTLSYKYRFLSLPKSIDFVYNLTE
jgi:hypothetical protein